MDGQPADGSDNYDFEDELRGDVGDVEVVPEEGNTRDVCDNGKHYGDDHLELDLVDLSEYVQQFDKNQSGEGNAYNVYKRVIKENDC